MGYIHSHKVRLNFYLFFHFEQKSSDAQTAFDVVAIPAETPFIQFAQQQGKQTISGAEVIVLQAVEQFELYTGILPDNQLVAEAADFARKNS